MWVYLWHSCYLFCVSYYSSTIMMIDFSCYVAPYFHHLISGNKCRTKQFCLNIMFILSLLRTLSWHLRWHWQAIDSSVTCRAEQLDTCSMANLSCLHFKTEPGKCSQKWNMVFGPESPWFNFTVNSPSLWAGSLCRPVGAGFAPGSSPSWLPEYQPIETSEPPPLGNVDLQ